MPAENIIAIHETVRNSGSSVSRPSGMSPYLLAASQIAKTTNPEATSTKNQPSPLIVHSSAVPEAEAREAVLTKPHTRKAIAITAVTPKTTLSTGRFLVASSRNW